jgi:hypothetical protein
MKRYCSAYALCPFYSCEDNQKIYCEGVEKGSSIHLAFGDSKNATAYKIKHCNCSYQNCMVYKMLMTKY